MENADPASSGSLYARTRYRVYDILVETDDGEVADRVVAILLMGLILLNAVAAVLETVESLNVNYGPVFFWIEMVSVSIFSVEYLLRLWVAPLSPEYSGRFGRLRYATSALAIIDLIAILPTFLPMFLPMDLRVVRFLRVFRLFRLFKLSRYVESLTRFDDVVRSKKEELVVMLVVVSMMLFFASSLMYLVEHEAQPDKFPDIPSAMWWGIATLTTVGYGDVFPITPMGKFLGAIVALLGVGIFALPAGILASGFAEEVRRKRAGQPCLCPQCGADVSEHFVRKE